MNLSEVIQKNELENAESEQDGEIMAPSSLLEKVKVPEFLNLRATTEESDGGNSTAVGSSGPRLYVRDDGTVDWEGALQDRAALRKFGGAVWARINGQTPDDLPEEDSDEKKGFSHESKPAVTAKIEDTPAIQEARKKLNELKEELKAKEKAHTALVESGTFSRRNVVVVELLHAMFSIF